MAYMKMVSLAVLANAKGVSPTRKSTRRARACARVRWLLAASASPSLLALPPLVPELGGFPFR